MLARALLGMLLRHRCGGKWTAIRIVETEAYYYEEQGSHSSQGYTHARRAMFMSPGTIYMYYARGGDSFNFSALGWGNAVLIKGGILYKKYMPSVSILQERLPSIARKPFHRWCAGQTLLCKALALKVPTWNGAQLMPHMLEIADDGYRPRQITTTTRLGIPPHRDMRLPYRFIDTEYLCAATKPPSKNRTLESHLPRTTAAHGAPSPQFFS